MPTEDKETVANLPLIQQNRDLNRWKYTRAATILVAVLLTLAAVLIFKSIKK